jgi:hypothetical protein
MQSDAARGILLSFVIGVVFGIVRTYRFDITLAYNGTDLVLPTKFISDPDLLAGQPLRDIIMGRLSPLQWALGHLGAWLSWDPIAVDYVRLVLLNVMAAVGGWALAWAMFRSLPGAVLSALLVAGGGAGVLGLSYDWLIGYVAEASYFGVAIGVFTLAALYSQKYAWAAWWVGVVLWVHPAYALVLAVVVASALIGNRDNIRLADAGRISLGFLASAMPALIYFGGNLEAAMATGITEGAWWSLMRARSPHHMFPFSWGLRFWSAALLFIAIGALARWIVVSEEKPGHSPVVRERTTLAVVLGAAAVCVVGIISSEVVPNVFLARLSLVRASVFVEIPLAMYIFHLIATSMSARTLLLWACGLAGALAVVFVEQSFRLTLPVILLACVVTRVYRYRAFSGMAPGRAWVAVAIVGCVAFTRVTAYMMNEIGPGDLAWKEAQLWARSNTAPSAVFITPLNTPGFEVFSERGTLVTISDLALANYSSGGIGELLRRLNAFGPPGFATLPLTRERLYAQVPRYSTLSSDEFWQVGKEFGAAYVVMERPATLSFPRAYENSHFSIYQLPTN